MNLLLPVVALSALPCLAAEPVELVYKFDADAPVRYVMVQDTVQDQAVQGQRVSTETSVSTHTTSRLLETNEDGSILVGSSTDRIVFSMSVPGMEIDYDSAKAADRAKMSNPTVASMAALVGNDVHLLIASDGTILDVPNIADLQARVNAMDDPNVRAGAALMTDKATVMATNEMNYKLLPAEPVEVGDTWARSFKIPFEFGEMTTNFDLKLDSVKDGIASISITGSMTMPEINQQQITVTMSDASVSGSLLFDIEDGVVNQMDLKTVTEMVGRMQGMADPILTMAMNQNTTMNRVED